MMTYMLLHKNPEGEAGKVCPTIDVVDAVEGDGVDGKNGVEMDEGAPGPTS
jgi:hypothetical protein